MSTTSPNMNLVIPTVGLQADAGPNYALEINSSLSTIDQHNHSSGSGVQINPSGININSSLAFNNNAATNVAAISLTGQSSTPANGSIYRNSNGYLYYVDGTSGTAIQITNSSGVNSGAGSINNLPSGTASASYLSGSQTFQWQSATSTAANLDFGSAVMRNLSPNSTYGVTVSPPASLATNYNLILPPSVTSNSFLTIAPSTGAITGSIPTANGITRSNLAAVGQQSSGASSGSTSSSTPVNLGFNVTITTSGRPVMVMLQPISNSGASTISVGGTAAPNGILYLYRGGSVINTLGFGCSLINGGSSSFNFIDFPCSSFIYFDAVGAGTYTYQLYASASGGSISLLNCNLIAYEL